MNFIKKKIFSLFNLILKKVIFKLEFNIKVDDHLRNVSRLKIDLNKKNFLSNKKEPSFYIDNLNVFFYEECDLNVLKLESISIQNSINLNIESDIKSSDCLKILLDTLKKSKINGNYEEMKSLKSFFRASFFIVKNNLLIKKHIKVLLKEIFQFLPPKAWLHPNKLIYGCSNILLLLSYLNKKKSSILIDNYLSMISERVLKKMEISQKMIFNFSNPSRDKQYKVLEQLKLIYFLIEYYEYSNDIRFLNAILKANDRLYLFFKKLSLNSANKINSLISLYYIKIIENQEKNFSKL